MLLTKYTILGFFIISVVIIIGLYNFYMNSSLPTLTNLVVYATPTTSHSDHMSEMNQNPSNTTVSEEDKKRFCGND